MAAGPLSGTGTIIDQARQPARNGGARKEIRLALGALSVAAAVAIGMGLMVESLRRDFTDMLDVRLAPGVYVQTASDVSASELDALREMDGVREVRRYGDVPGRVQPRSRRHPHRGVGRPRVRPVRLRSGSHRPPRHDQRGGCAPPTGSRQSGDVVDLVVAGRSFPVEIAHVFRDFGAASPPGSSCRRPSWPNSIHRPSAWRRVSVLADPDAVREA